VDFGVNRGVQFFCIVVLLAAPAALLGQTGRQSAESGAGGPESAAQLPRVGQILDRYIQATGGRAAWENIHSRVSTGVVDIPGLQLAGTAEMYERAPNLALVKMVVGGSVFLEGFDGAVGWSSDPKDGLQEQRGAQLAATRRESDFRFPLDFRRLYQTVSAARNEKIGGRPVYVIDATPREGGQPDHAYFDAQTGFLVRMVIQHHDDDGSVQPFEEDYGDYRLVDGVKIPFLIHQSGAQVDFTIRLKEVRQNVDVDDTQFSEPGKTVVK
jgi:hypothetical protein